MRVYYFLLTMWLSGPVDCACPKENHFDSGDGMVIWKATVNGDTGGSFTLPGGVILLDMDINTIQLLTDFPAEIMRVREVSLETQNIAQVILKGSGKQKKLKGTDWVMTSIKVQNLAVDSMMLGLVKGDGVASVRKLTVKGCVHVGWCSWGKWGSCSATCGKGKRQRMRSCGCRSPVADVFLCKGKDTQKGTCSITSCYSRLAQEVVDRFQVYNDAWRKKGADELTKMFYTKDTLFVQLQREALRGLKVISENIIAPLQKAFPVITTQVIEAVGLSENTVFTYNSCDFFTRDGTLNMTRRYFGIWRKIGETWYVEKAMSNME